MDYKLNMYAYSNASKSARLLCEHMGIQRILHENSRYRGGDNKWVINWGSSKLPDEVMYSRIINDPRAVSIASNKLRFFQHCNGKFNHPDWTTDRKVAESWLFDSKVVCREKLSAHSGVGIVVASTKEEIIDAPLYTRYIPKDKEYRVHVVGDGSIFVQRKVLKRDHQGPVNWQVRNHANGFVFQQNGIEWDPSVCTEALKATAACGLDFGGVDVIWRDRVRTAFVIEVNTAPGIEGSRVPAYGTALRELIEKRINGR